MARGIHALRVVRRPFLLAQCSLSPCQTLGLISADWGLVLHRGASKDFAVLWLVWMWSGRQRWLVGNGPWTARQSSSSSFFLGPPVKGPFPNARGPKPAGRKRASLPQLAQQRPLQSSSSACQPDRTSRGCPIREPARGWDSVPTHLPREKKASRNQKKERANKVESQRARKNGIHSQAILNFRLAVGSATA
jgi:hypothetical protein